MANITPLSLADARNAWLSDGRFRRLFPEPGIRWRRGGNGYACGCARGEAGCPLA